MADNEVTQKVAAILAADAVGYSRLMSDDEPATIDALDAARAVFIEHIEANQGRVVDTAGDSVLAVFETAAGAVLASVAIQERLAEINEPMPETRRMLFRIGIHLGDIHEKADGTIYGDGVNIAARLEGIAAPGGIAASEVIQGAVKGRVDAPFAFLGEHEVKNIAEPVRAYSLGDEAASSAKPKARPFPIKALAATAALVIVIGAAAWLLTPPVEPTETAQDPALTLPTGPKIAVLPLTNLSGDPDEEYFSDGLTEDIINRLTNFPNMLVFPRNATSKYKGQEVDAATVGTELGAEYVVEGSVRRADGHLRVTIQMLDAVNGTNLWAKTYDRDLTAANIFEVQDAVTEGIVNSLGDYSGVIARAELKQAAGKTLTNMTALECSYHFAVFYDSPSPEKHLEIRSCLERAVESDPDFAPARAWLGLSYLDEYRWGMNPLPNSLDRALASVRKGIEMDPNFANAHQIEAEIRFHRGELESVLISAERAIALSPHNATFLAAMGNHIGWAGNMERGVAMVQKAIAINPNHPPWYHYMLTDYFIRKGDHVTALGHALRLTWGLSWDYMYRTVIYARSGRMDEARTEADELREVYPDFGKEMRGEFEKYYFPDEVIGAYFETLREVGIDIPEPTN
jgi:adenylate cyclase